MEEKVLVDEIENVIRQKLVDTHTIMVCKVVKVNAATIDCKPVISRLINTEKVDIPVLSDIPVVNLQGGSNYIVMPISIGDYCLVLISERAIDRWYDGDDNQVPDDFRMHDYSDGFALVGINPLSSQIPIPTGKTILNGDHTFQGDVIVNGNLTINGNGIVTGDLTVDGAILGKTTITADGAILGQTTVTAVGAIAAASITGGGLTASGGTVSATVDMTAGGISLTGHTHSGVTTGGGSTGGPQ